MRSLWIVDAEIIGGFISKMTLILWSILIYVDISRQDFIPDLLELGETYN